VRVSRGDCYYSYLKDYPKALEDYSTAIELDPNFTEAWHSRGLAHAASGQFGKAAQDLAKTIELGWGGAGNWYYRALTELGAGNIEKYRSTCATILERFGETEKPAEARWVSWTCVLAPNAVENLGQAVKLAEGAVDSDPNSDQNRNTLSAILCRAGRFDEAVQQLGKLTDAWEQGKELPTLTSPAYTWFFMAMTHHQLGNSEEAKVWLERAVERAEEELAGTPSWNRKLTLQLFRQEAESLIKGEKVEDR
jgi:tetratricopeptide (TPR) repeat protein